MATPAISDISALLQQNFEENKEQKQDNNPMERDNLEGSAPIDQDAMLKALDPSYEPEKAENKAESVEGESPEVNEEQGESPEQSETANESDESQDDGRLGSLAELANELGVDAAALYDLEVPIHESESIKIGQFKDLWQQHLSNEGEVEAQKSELANQKQTYEQQLAQLAQFQQLPQELMQAEAAFLKAENDINSVDWVALESANPAQAALQRQKLSEARALADQHRQYVASNLQLMQKQIQDQRQAELGKYYEQRSIEMRTIIPDWADESKAQAGRLELESFLAKEGIPEDVFKGVLDHGHPSLVKALKRLSEHDKAAQKVNKQPPKLPKTLSTATVHKSTKGKQAVLDKILKKGKESKDSRDKINAVSALLRS